MDSSFQELQLVTVWSSPSSYEVAQFISKILSHHKGNSENTLPLQLHFVDATNSFPIAQFKKIVPVSEETKYIYDNIRITTCLDITELNRTVNRMIQLISIDQLQRYSRIKNGITDREADTASGTSGILLIINGLEVMFRNSQINESQEQAHLLLRDVMLRLRATANQPDGNNDLQLKNIIIFPSSELFRYVSNNNNTKKRIKSNNTIKGNTLGEYVSKFYADEMIS